MFDVDDVTNILDTKFAEISRNLNELLDKALSKHQKDVVSPKIAAVPVGVDLSSGNGGLFPISRGLRNGLSILQEFYIEFFGLFIPGFVFVMSFLLMAYFAYKHMFAQTSCFILADLFGYIWVQLFIVCLSYVVGTVLYRKAPKRPDRISAYSQWARTTLPLERNRLSVQYDANRDKPPRLRNTLDWLRYILSPESYILSLIYQSQPRHIPDYPYPHLRQYLLQRGMWHLLPYVPWCANAEYNKEKDENSECVGRTIFERSKHLINIIKQRIRVYGVPSVNSDIIRNESQIRLLCSIWYAMRYLLICGLFIVGYPVLGLVIRGCAYISHVLVSTDVVLFRWPDICGGWTFLFCMIAVVMIIWWVKVNIAEVIHYMRNREVVMILESAYLIDKIYDTEGKPGVFQDIKDRTSEFIREFKSESCSKCPKWLADKCKKIVSTLVVNLK